MTVAYVDTSCLVAVALDEPAASDVAARLAGFDRLISSNLLEAELRAVFVRESMSGAPVELLAEMVWVYPNRPLTPEFDRVTSVGYLKGADLWHVACALFVAPGARGLSFMTLDRLQAEIARRLRFTVPVRA